MSHGRHMGRYIFVVFRRTRLDYSGRSRTTPERLDETHLEVQRAPYFYWPHFLVMATLPNGLGLQQEYDIACSCICKYRL
jgi:hypothetical protein